MADFPTSVYAPRTKQNRSAVVYDPAQSKRIYAEDITKLDAEIVALETWIESVYNFDEGTLEIANATICDSAYIQDLEVGSILYLAQKGLNIGTAFTPASASAQGNKGTICWDTSYIYVCTATNTWKRVAISSW